MASFELSPADPCAGAAVRLIARRAYAAGGQLLGAGCDLRKARPLEEGQIGEYGFSRGADAFAYTVQGKDGAALVG